MILKIASIIPLLFRQSHAAGSNWILGAVGETCDTACQRTGGVCNPVEQSKLTSGTLLEKAMLEAGYTCMAIGGHRDYAGTPFSTGRLDDCYYMSSGGESVCTGNRYQHHRALCYCDLPTATPTRRPTTNPTPNPTRSPTSPTGSPTRSPTRPPTPFPTMCKDTFSWCAYLAMLDKCDDADFFRLYCPFTCDNCSTESPTSMPTASPTEYSDDTLGIMEGVIDYLFKYALQCKED